MATSREREEQKRQDKLEELDRLVDQGTVKVRQMTDEERAKLLADPSLVPSAVEESLRMFPAFAHFRRTTTRETELHGRRIGEGE